MTEEERQRKLEELLNGTTTQYTEKKWTLWREKAGFYRIDIETTGGKIPIHLTNWGIKRLHVSRLVVGNSVAFSFAVRDVFIWWTQGIRIR